ncbi:HNH endonuclease [Kocuria sabuli]|uniref:HNH endonuclease n=1 Tax=Kocuria sabuli TaxID=3071448 RepID=UPI0034D51834
MFSQLVPAPSGPGWYWAGKTNAHGYGLVIPVGGTARHQFLAHRVMFDLFSPTGGHRVTEVLDHRDGDRLNTAIWNLEAVSVAENLRRRRRPPRGPLPRMWSYPAALFAGVYNLPVPDGFPTVPDFLGIPDPPVRLLPEDRVPPVA